MNIKEKRIELKMTQFDLARACGVSPNTIMRWESNVCKPSDENMEKLKKALEGGK